MNKINFQDIQAQHLNRYQLIKVSGTDDQYDLVPVRGAVTQEGTPIRALELNQLQDNVDAAKVDKSDYTFPLVAGTTAGNAPNFTLTLDPPLTAYTPGLMLNVNFHTSFLSNWENKLNIDGLGDKIIVRILNGSPYPYFDMPPAAGVHTLMYDGTYWILYDPLSRYGGSVGGNVSPVNDNSYTLGTSSKRWMCVYANGMYQAGSKVWDAGSLPYEAEGTWTPRLYFTADNSYVAGTSGSTWGQYVRIGNMVCCTFLYTYSGAFPSGTTGTSNLVYISGFPFAAAYTTNVSIPYYTSANMTSFPGIFGSMNASNSLMRLSAGNGNTFDNFLRDTLAGKSGVRFSASFCYLI